MNAFRMMVLSLGLATLAACSAETGGEGLNPYASGESEMSSGAFSPEAAQQPPDSGGGSASSAESSM